MLFKGATKRGCFVMNGFSDSLIEPSLGYLRQQFESHITFNDFLKFNNTRTCHFNAPRH